MIWRIGSTLLVFLNMLNSARSSECDMLLELVQEHRIHSFYNCSVDIEVKRSEFSGNALDGSIYVRDHTNGAEVAIPFRRQSCEGSLDQSLIQIHRARRGFTWILNENATIWRDSATRLLRVEAMAEGVLDGKTFKRVADCRGVNPRLRLDRER